MEKFQINDFHVSTKLVNELTERKEVVNPSSDNGRSYLSQKVTEISAEQKG